ncbi:hypothetical protein D9757_001654 [Collybiopsis confluens]|uniref:Uncharacterized protein n=1 Tax=Collybiopsis confluens TaxID=2823264 RepID=A0A8H5HYN7_9AGAR|nr:hypothetical protein D9757_001654 [Collybiopsis confluens]
MSNDELIKHAGPSHSSSNMVSSASRSSSRARRISREDAWDNGVTRPTAEQKAVLLSNIRASSLPGCETYSERNFNVFFANRRAKSSSALKPSQIENLQTLFCGIGKDSDPTDELIIAWADLLGAGVPGIKAWIATQRRPSSYQLPPTPLSLPSPSRFPSPEQGQEHLASSLLLSPLAIPVAMPAEDNLSVRPSAPLLNLPLQPESTSLPLEATINSIPPAFELSWVPSLKHLLQ